MRAAPPFGQRLQALRKERGLSQSELAKMLGISRPMVEYYERRAPNPSIGIVAEVARIFQVAPSALLGEEPPQKKKRGPPSFLEEKLAEVKKLPRKKQEMLGRMIDAFLAAERRSA